MKNRTKYIVAGLVIIAVVFIIYSASGISFGKNKRHLTVVFYNVENLFDTVDDPHKNDNEFTPQSDKNWTEERYHKKLDDLARVLSSVNKDDLPEIIGLAEVENRKVLLDLVQSDGLKKGKYRIIHFESPDVRGIDCALLYRPKEFKPVKSFPVRIKSAGDLNFKTRDILYVKGLAPRREELHIFVNHWPSRVGGQQESEPKRMEVAAILKSKIDSIENVNPGANIIVIGDMNDEPTDKSLHEVLGAQKPGDTSAGLVNLMFADKLENKGSYYYRGHYNMLDNIVVSTSLLDNRGFVCNERKGRIFQQEWMVFKNRDGSVSPNRTYGGNNYYGGISDHFPVYFELSR